MDRCRSQALTEFYGQDFLRNALPGTDDVEAIPKDRLLSSLNHATRGTQKGPYHKIDHGAALLERIDPGESAPGRGTATCCSGNWKQSSKKPERGLSPAALHDRRRGRPHHPGTTGVSPTFSRYWAEGPAFLQANPFREMKRPLYRGGDRDPDVSGRGDPPRRPGSLPQRPRPASQEHGVLTRPRRSASCGPLPLPRKPGTEWRGPQDASRKSGFPGREKPLPLPQGQGFLR